MTDNISLSLAGMDSLWPGEQSQGCTRENLQGHGWWNSSQWKQTRIQGSWR